MKNLLSRWPAAAVLIVLLAGCGGNGGTSTQTGDTQATAPAEPNPSGGGPVRPSADEPPPPPEKPHTPEPVSEPSPPHEGPNLTISGTPSTSAQVGYLWTFRPTIEASDGDTYHVNVANLPGWLTLAADTGRLFGTPNPEDAGVWQDIRVQVSSGDASATLPAFQIEVLDERAATGTALLSWTPPTERVDGSPVGPLAGYRVLYGQVSGAYDNAMMIDNPGITSLLLEDLEPGTWHFALVAITADGLASAPSQEVSKEI